MTLEFARVDNWQRLLNEHLIESQRLYNEHGLKWGVFDCCTFAFDWVEKITGVDVMGLPGSEYRGQYVSAETAIRLFWKNEDKTLEGALLRVFGEPVPAAMGRRGDIVLWREEGAPCLGIMVTQGAHQCGVFLGENGFIFVGLREIESAYRV
jgi:hypothetical protein